MGGGKNRTDPISNVLSEIFSDPARIIKEAAKGPLGIIAMVFLFLAFLAFYFFKQENVNIRLLIFGCMCIIGILSFFLAVYPIVYPSNKPSGKTGEPKPYAPYGLKFSKIIWKHSYFENYDFKGEIECFIKNISNTNISNLPPQQGGWSGWGIQDLELKTKIYGNETGNYTLNKLLFAGNKIIRRDIDGSDKKITFYTWQFQIVPPLPPGKSFHYGQIIGSKNTEAEAFTEKGSFAGMSSPFPVDVLLSEISAPAGYRFINKGYSVRDSMGIEISDVSSPPEFADDGNKITWAIENPVPSINYFVRIVIAKRT